MTTKNKPVTVTKLDEIRAQAEPEIIELPGFRSGAVIYVAVRMIDLTPKFLELRSGNALLAEAAKKVKKGKEEGKSDDEIKEDLVAEVEGNSNTAAELFSIMDEVAAEALVDPTYEEITAIHPLTLMQKAVIFNYVMGEDLLPFRSE